MLPAKRHSTRRRKFRKAVARGHPPCALCGQEIDYAASHLEPLSFEIDHIIPIDRGGPDTLDNCQPAHRKCNRDKSNRLPGEVKGKPRPKPERRPVSYATDRSW